MGRRQRMCTSVTAQVRLKRRRNFQAQVALCGGLELEIIRLADGNVEAIHQECLQRLASLPALTATHSPHIVRDLRRRTWSTPA